DIDTSTIQSRWTKIAIWSTDWMLGLIWGMTGVLAFTARKLWTNWAYQTELGLSEWAHLTKKVKGNSGMHVQLCPWLPATTPEYPPWG
ncbi:hypothetical protein ACJX0J_007741, partial [Zea mays]